MRSRGGVARRRPGSVAAVLVAVVLVASVGAVQLRSTLPRLVETELHNPDSYYKLALLNDRESGQPFAFVARDNAPHGSWLHWSVPHSATVWQLHRLLRAAGVDKEPALRYAGAALTLLSMLAVALGLALAVLRTGTPRTAMLSGLTLAAAVPFHAYGRVLQITHHIFMLVPLAGAAACLLHGADRPRRPLLDLCGGLLLGLALWVSPETLPFVVGLSGVRVALRLQYPATSALWPVAAGLCAAVLLAWRLDPPPPGFSAWALDHVSLAYVALATALAAVLVVADVCAGRQWPLRLSLPVVVALAVGAAALWLLAVPGARDGPAGLVTARLQELFWDQIVELKPADRPSKWVAFLMLPLAAALLAGLRAWRRRELWVAALAVMALAYGVLGVWHVRMGAAAAVAAALALPVGAALLRGMDAAHDERLSRRDLVLALGVALLPHLQFVGYAALTRLENAPPASDPSACRLQPVAAALNRLPPATILTALSSGPELLYRTHHRTIAGPYHHNLDGMLDNFDAWLDAGDGAAEAVVRRRGVAYVLACERFPPVLLGTGGRRTLAQRAASGDVPSWLQPVDWPAGVDTDWRLYRVRFDPAADENQERARHE